MYGDQRSACGNIQGGGEFEEIFAALVPTADKNRNGKW